MAGFFKRLAANFTERVEDFKDRAGPGGRHVPVFTTLGMLGGMLAGAGAALLALAAFYTFCGAGGLIGLIAAGAVLGGIGGEGDDFAKGGLLGPFVPGMIAGAAAFSAVAGTGIGIDAVLETAIGEMRDAVKAMKEKKAEASADAAPEAPAVLAAPVNPVFVKTKSALDVDFGRATALKIAANDVPRFARNLSTPKP